jgi:hypothetical protein
MDGLGLLITGTDISALYAQKCIVNPFAIFLNICIVQLGDKIHQVVAVRTRRIGRVLYPRRVSADLREGNGNTVIAGGKGITGSFT